MSNFPTTSVKVTFNFSEETSYLCESYPLYNKTFIDSKEKFLNDLIFVNGFISKIDILEALGIGTKRDYGIYVDDAKHVITEPFKFKREEKDDGGVFLSVEMLY